MNKNIIIGVVLAGLVVVAYIDDPTIFDTSEDTEPARNNKGMMTGQGGQGQAEKINRQGQLQPQHRVMQQTNRVRTQGEKRLPKGSVRVRPAKVMDRNGFKRPFIAQVAMIPVGWKTQGGVNWINRTIPCGPKVPHYRWQATAPDGIGQISFLPEEEWSGFHSNSGMQGLTKTQCPNVTSTNTKQFILGYVKRYRPNAKILDYRPHQEINRIMEKIIRAFPTYGYAGVKQRKSGGAGQVLIGYQVNGVEVRELVTAGVLFITTSMAGVYQGEVRTSVNVLSLPGFAFRMRDGDLNFRQAEMFRRVVKPMPEYAALIQAHNAKMNAINMKGLKDRGNIISKNQAEINNIINKGWKNRQAMKDAGHRKTINALRGVNTYRNPNAPGGSVDLDNSYKNAWQLNDGTYVLTDDPSFKPYLYTGQEGKLLKRMR